ncbi:MAG: hypothetical protein AB4426_07420 [Xenococcaceae cyanobacterium]
MLTTGLLEFAKVIYKFEAVLQDTASTTIHTSTAWGQTSIQFPRIQGADIVGKVVEVGSGVDPKLL